MPLQKCSLYFKKLTLTLSMFFLFLISANHPPVYAVVFLFIPLQRPRTHSSLNERGQHHIEVLHTLTTHMPEWTSQINSGQDVTSFQAIFWTCNKMLDDHFTFVQERKMDFGCSKTFKWETMQWNIIWDIRINMLLSKLKN